MVVFVSYDKILCKSFYVYLATASPFLRFLPLLPRTFCAVSVHPPPHLGKTRDYTLYYPLFPPLSPSPSILVNSSMKTAGIGAEVPLRPPIARSGLCNCPLCSPSPSASSPPSAAAKERRQQSSRGHRQTHPRQTVAHSHRFSCQQRRRHRHRQKHSYHRRHR